MTGALKIMLPMLAVAAAAGCATESRTYGPDGRVAHSITCSGAMLTMGSCFEKAGELCGPAGYDIVGGSNERGAVASTTFATTTSARSLVVSCKDGR